MRLPSTAFILTKIHASNNSSFNARETCCELRTHARRGGVEVQVLVNGTLFIMQKFGRRDWALEWAEFKRRAIEKVKTK